MASSNKAKMPASFRGAGFYVVGNNSGTVGRRTVEHAYPLRDQPYTEDMGRKPQTFVMQALVIGPHCEAERDALIDACEQAGPGPLVHPTRGTVQVICTNCKYDESTEEGGLVRFALTFQEAGKRDFPAKKTDFASQAGGVVDDTKKTAKGVFAEIFSLIGPAWIAAAAKGDFSAALSLVKSVAEVMPAPFDPDAVADVVNTINQTIDAMESLAPSVLAGYLSQALDDLAAAAGDENSQAVVDAALEIITFNTEAQVYGTKPDEVETNTPSREQQKANQDAITALVHELALAMGIDAALKADYYSYEEADGTRSRLLTALDGQMIATSTDDEYEALRRLYVSTNDAFKQLGTDLAHVQEIQVPAGPTSALTLAYDLYEDLARADEIALKNAIHTPAMLPSGETIRVLNG